MVIKDEIELSCCLSNKEALFVLSKFIKQKSENKNNRKISEKTANNLYRNDLHML